MKNGRGQFSAKFKYFFDLLNNIKISSKLRTVVFFYSFDTLNFDFVLGRMKIFFGKIFEKMTFFAVIRKLLANLRSKIKSVKPVLTTSGVYGSNGTTLDFVSQSVRSLGGSLNWAPIEIFKENSQANSDHSLIFSPTAFSIILRAGSV